MSQLTENVTLWPPITEDSSWSSDVPNEGLTFVVKEEYAIVDTFADYQGLYLLEPLSEIALFTRLNITPTRNQQYLTAYKVILEEFAVYWSAPLDPEINFLSIVFIVVNRLKELGWFEIEEAAEGSVFWKIKGST